jgi:hypothetical protein
MAISRFTVACFAFGMAACSGGAAGYFAPSAPADPAEEMPGSTQQPLEALVPLATCGEVEGYLRARIVADVDRRVDAMIAQIQKPSYGGCYTYGGSSGTYYDAGAGGPPPPPSAPSGGATSGSSSSGSSGAVASDSASEGATSTSKTNNQVAGVDEADFVKNDDKYLYVVANGALRILQAWPPESAATVARIPLEGQPRKLFVEGDRALVYLALPRAREPYSGSSSGGYAAEYSGGRECTYGYDCVPSGDGTRTKVVVFDIANRAAPVKLRELELSGSLLSARRIGEAVHTVVVDPPAAIAGLESAPPSTETACISGEDTVDRKARLIEAWNRLRERNLARARTADVLSKLPAVTEGGASLPQCSGYYRPNIAEGRTFTTLVSVDMFRSDPPTSATIVSDPGVVYASATGLYMSVPRKRVAAQPWYDGMADADEASTVHKFRIGATPSLTGYEASGIVKGRVLNQFALDEHDEHLRVATTTGRAPSPTTHSTMSVLARRGKSLVLTGKVDHIAPSEDIRSVRFDGSRGFVVTFKKTDPLYVFDLGDPAAPSIAGELKIPGFSTYMHMMDAQHLLTIGYDAADQGSFAYFQGVMLQIFDVSDMRNPLLAHKEIIGTRGSSSEALTNHLAFNYYGAKDLLALPMTICEGGTTSSMYGTTMTFSGLLVYDVTAEAGFHPRGRVAHPNASSGTSYNSTGCSNWWTNATSEVQRSVIMDTHVYSVSNRRVKVNALSNLAVDVAELSLEN